MGSKHHIRKLLGIAGVIIVILLFLIYKNALIITSYLQLTSAGPHVIPYIQTLQAFGDDPMKYLKQYVHDQILLWMNLPTTLDPIDRKVVKSHTGIFILDELLSFVYTTKATWQSLPAGIPTNAKIALSIGLTTTLESERIAVDVQKKAPIPCPPGFRNDGSFCAKPAPYGRGAGYVSKNACLKHANDCERNLLLWYPVCKSGYHPVGCCICSPDCPPGYLDIGVSCAKPNV
jgi:hypothetical protein